MRRYLPPTLSVEYRASLVTAIQTIKADSLKSPSITAGAKSFTARNVLDKSFADGYSATEYNALLKAVESNKLSGVIFKLNDGAETVAEYKFTIDTTAIKNTNRVESLSLAQDTFVFGGQERTFNITYKYGDKLLFADDSEYRLSKTTEGSYPETYTSGIAVTVSGLKTNFSCACGKGASYRFKGWYLDKALTVPFDGTIPAGNVGSITLYADIEMTGTHFY